tara:strand:- start:3854 stop:4363 length:510 start_codon:yes stop_codon:yes gene_type:complete
MSTKMGNIIEVADPANPGLPGNRSSETLRAAFPQSPLYSGEKSRAYKGQDEAVRKLFRASIEGTILNGFGFTEYNTDYSNAGGPPDIPSVEEDNAGNPIVSPYAPNIASAPAGAIGQENEVHPVKGGGSAFAGNNLANPVSTTDQISGQRPATIGAYGLGSSKPATDNG